MADERWIARPACISDFEKFSDLRSVGREVPNLSSSRRSSDAKYFCWKLIDNPVQEGFANVADYYGQIVGTTTITPKELGIKGERVRGAEIGDTFTHPDFQRQGIFTALVNVSKESAIECGLKFIYGTPNNNSLPGYEKKCNFIKIDSVNIQMLICPVNFSNILATKLPSVNLAKIVSPFISFTFKLLFSNRYQNVKNNNISVIKLKDEFPQSVNELAQKSLKQYDAILFRNKKYLDWRFVYNPDQYHIWIIQKNEECLGYIVCKHGLWKGQRVGYITDFLVDMDYCYLYKSLVVEAMNFFIKDKVDMIACWAVSGAPYSRILKRCGFLKAWDLPLICYKNEIGLFVSSSVNTWHFTMTDSDNI